MEKASQIKQINVENENSAFIEILVGDENDDEDDFKSLLPVTSFMTPGESKTKTNANKLKIFTDETHLNKDVASKKFPVVKIFCTQPFNRVDP